MTVICDWLDVTYKPDEVLPEALTNVLNDSLFSVVFSGPCQNGTRDVWKALNGGSVVVSKTSFFNRVSASGRALSHIRDVGSLHDYLAALSEKPHRITRLDAALDIDHDAAAIIALLIKQYPRNCLLTRKKVKTNWILETRDDGLTTGTFYAGKPHDRSVSARVYDKQLEVLVNTGVVIPPRTRIEVSAHKGNHVTLRDAALPENLFYHLASPSLIEKPDTVGDWQSANPDDTGWRKNPMPHFPPYQVLKNRVAANPDLKELIRMADRVGPLGRESLERLIHAEIFPEETRERKAELKAERGKVS